MNNSLNYDEEDINISTILPWQLKTRFYLLLVLQLPSLCCAIFILYYFNWKQLKSQIYGFIIIINILIIIIELPITLYFLYVGTVGLESICTSWIILHYSLFLLNITMIALASIERYLFIYNEQMIMQHTILLHYGPIVYIVLYCPLFYIGAVLLSKCNPIYNSQLYLCGGACYELEPVQGMMDRFANIMFTVTITFIVNAIVIVRLLVQRHRMKNIVITVDRTHRWRRSVKFSMRLLLMGMVHTIAWIPYSTIVIMQIFENTEELEYLRSTFFIYFPYIQVLLLPYICLLSIPEIKQKFITLVSLLYCGKNIHQLNRIQIINHK